ncbi:MAG: arginase family protein [Crocinitomicaceae bacterium]|nr:arginase family protein [Crocinitomicaceae bacterium]
MNKNKSLDFVPFNQEQLNSFLSLRAGEVKLGERIQFDVSNTTKFVILGISEDIGPRANNGNGGAANAFNAFLSKFLNMQSNEFLSGEDVAVIGTIHASSNSNEVSALREKVAELDSLVIGTLSKIDFINTQLIVIGGGHNNAYPIMKALSAQHDSLHILNIDPHADCRPLEGRHSGNPFSTAILEEIISSYTVFGLHEQYNSTAILDFLKEHNCETTFFENYLDGRSLSDDLKNYLASKGNSFGVEIDLDCIENMPTSAFTPSGFSLNEIRQAVRQLAKSKPIYLHLPEGAPKNPEEKTIVGKALAYLTTDFVKSSK